MKWVQNGTNKQAFIKVKKEVMKIKVLDIKLLIIRSIILVYNFYNNVKVKGNEECIIWLIINSYMLLLIS
jgi:hypothetical protein